MNIMQLLSRTYLHYRSTLDSKTSSVDNSETDTKGWDIYHQGLVLFSRLHIVFSIYIYSMLQIKFKVQTLRPSKEIDWSSCFHFAMYRVWTGSLPDEFLSKSMKRDRSYIRIFPLHYVPLSPLYVQTPLLPP